MSASLRPVVEKVAAKLLQSLSPTEALPLLAVSNQIDNLLGEEAVTKLILLGLTSQSSTKKALDAISNNKDLELLRSKLDTKTKELNIALAETSKTKAVALELEQKITSLEAKIAKAGEASESVRDGVKQQFALDAARKVVRILAFIDAEFGHEYEGKPRVLSLAQSLEISSFATVGEVAIFNFTHFDDYEGRSAEGDSVKVLAPGYLWGSEEDSIVLLKAVVTK
jgi:hypothetical protein